MPFKIIRLFIICLIVIPVQDVLSLTPSTVSWDIPQLPRKPSWISGKVNGWMDVLWQTEGGMVVVAEAWALSHCVSSALASPVLKHTVLLFMYWGHGLSSWRYQSYLSVVTCSLEIFPNSPSLHCHDNTMRKTTKKKRKKRKCLLVPVKLDSLLSAWHVKCLTSFAEDNLTLWAQQTITNLRLCLVSEDDAVGWLIKT